MKSINILSNISDQEIHSYCFLHISLFAQVDLCTQVQTVLYETVNKNIHTHTNTPTQIQSYNLTKCLELEALKTINKRLCEKRRVLLV